MFCGRGWAGRKYNTIEATLTQFLCRPRGTLKPCLLVIPGLDRDPRLSVASQNDKGHALQPERILLKRVRAALLRLARWLLQFYRWYHRRYPAVPPL